MTRARLPFLLVMAAVLVGAFVVERDQGRETAPERAADTWRAAPLVAGDDVLGSAWFCAAGSSDPEGPADHTVVVANPGDADREVTLTAFPGTSEPVSITLEVPAASLERVPLADLVEAPAVAALVETHGGGLTVTHELVGPLGTDAGPCASTTSDVWHFAWGDTSRDARALVALFNPFPADAVADFEFVTIDGVRRPTALTGVVVPHQSVVVVDVGVEIARRDQVSTTVTARSGRLVVERLQLFDDSEEMLEGAEPRRGLTVGLGSPVPMETWVFPGVRLVEGLQERVVVYNPADATAEVDVEFLPAGTASAVEPFELSVPPRSYEVLDLHREARLGELFDELDAVEATVVVRSLNDVAVVAERVTIVPTSAEGPGVAAVTGIPLVGRQLVVVDPRPLGADAASLVLWNPDPEELVTGTITVVSRGTGRPLAQGGTFELAPQGRAAFDLVARVSGAGTSVLIVEADRPIAGATVSRSSGPADRHAAIAVVGAPDAVPSPSLLGAG
jgi:hypothetical protein